MADQGGAPALGGSGAELVVAGLVDDLLAVFGRGEQRFPRLAGTSLRVRVGDDQAYQVLGGLGQDVTRTRLRSWVRDQ